MMNADCQLGLPDIGIQEDRIAINTSLECQCGLNHFVPCEHRIVCLGLHEPNGNIDITVYKAAERQAEDNYLRFLERIPAK